MAGLLSAERVQILCPDSSVQLPISRLYFCRYCLKLKSGQCVSHEVDSHYCPNCLENMPSAEAKIKKNRCGNCFDCPSCRHTLSTRATSIAIPNPNDPAKPTTKKAYYLACGFCRWTSRDIGMPDKHVEKYLYTSEVPKVGLYCASGAWQVPDNPYTDRLNELLDYYKQLAQREKQERERKRYSRRRSYFHLQEKYLSPVSTRRRSGALLSALSNLSVKESEQNQNITIKGSEAVDEVEKLPPEIYTEPLNLASVCTITQRLSQPEYQPHYIKQLYPMHKHLLIKRSQRCRECEHNLSKPEFNPSSIKFKIQLVALHHVPEIRIFSIPNLYFEKESQVTLMLINPVEDNTHVTLEAVEPSEDNGATALVKVPESELVLAAKDDTADYDDNADLQDFKDDPSVINFRKANKLGFFVKVTPQKAVGDVIIMMKVKYDYRDLAAQFRRSEEEREQDREAPIVWLDYQCLINLGQPQ
ncbi:dynactin subunit 4-like isoform X2 [Ptychodera flava]|uniref:dynactin subunit 4-like isoform X2 n=1 Tax=Ptychodera flava TaxID=63121 RepID=UPI00396A467B